MEDWRYEGLRRDIDRLEKQLRNSEDRTYEVQQWQRLLPMRVTEAIFWLIAAGFVIFSLASVLARSMS
ncbi:MAG TPA: hypothetical protein VFJ61_08030 [Solirubrobacterales bacterium]|nr:hypothetical protein [Solirubrobacterales bacterium]